MTAKAGRLIRDIFNNGEILELGRRIEQDEAMVVEALCGKAREAAMAATAMLITVDPNDIPQVRQCQDEIRRYSDLIVWIREIAAEARNVADELDEDDRRALDDLLYSQTGAAEAVD
jgi:hypothetical protein